jgi:hypothetical protein
VKNRLIILLLVCTAIMSNACGQARSAASVAPTQPAAPVTTAPTRQALSLPLSSPTTAPIQPPTAVSTLAPVASATLAPTMGAAATIPSGCSNHAELVSSSRYPSDASLSNSQQFTLNWQFKNVGTCTWTTGYSLILVSGDKLTMVSSSAMPGPVAPNETVKASVTLVTPNQDGDYIQKWMLQDEAGNTFGIGPQADVALIVPLTVATHKISKDPANSKDPCV